MLPFWLRRDADGHDYILLPDDDAKISDCLHTSTGIDREYGGSNRVLSNFVTVNLFEGGDTGKILPDDRVQDAFRLGEVYI